MLLKLCFISVITLICFYSFNMISTIQGQGVNHAKLFSEKFGGNDSSSFSNNFSPTTQSVEVVYDSPTTIVFRGDLLTQFTSVPNTKIWAAVDLLKGEGYQLNQIVNTGSGTAGNPHTLYIIMSKPLNSIR
jgi:hypothetical protein